MQVKRTKRLIDSRGKAKAAPVPSTDDAWLTTYPNNEHEPGGERPVLLQSPRVSGKGESVTILTTAVFATIGLASIAGGWVGYKKANSKPSLIAGGVSGLSMLAAATLTAAGNVGAGLFIGGVTCVALAGRFIPAYLRTRKVMPAGVMSVLAGCGVLATLIGFLSL